MLRLVALVLLAGTTPQGAGTGPGDLAFEWHVHGRWVAGNCEDRNADGLADYVVCGPNNRVRVFSSANDTEIPSSPEQLTRAQEVARSLDFSATKDPHFETAPAFEWLRKLPERERSRARAIVPGASSGPRWTERIVVDPYSTLHIRWLELSQPEPRAALLPRTECSFDYAFIADVDRDSVEDVIVHSHALFDDAMVDTAGLIAFSGKSGAELWHMVFGGAPPATSDYTLPGWQNIVAPGDLDGDEIPDFVVANPTDFFEQPQRPSSILAVSGKSGAILWRQSDEGKLGETLGASVALVVDRDGDGVRDVVFAHGEAKPDNASTGGVQEAGDNELGIVSGKTGAILKRWAP